MVIARNELFRLSEARNNRNGSAVFQEMFYNEPADQLEALIEEDRQRILKLCLETLDERSRDLIGYMFKRPEASLVRISKVFGISPLNVRNQKIQNNQPGSPTATRRSRLNRRWMQLGCIFKIYSKIAPTLSKKRRFC